MNKNLLTAAICCLGGCLLCASVQAGKKMPASEKKFSVCINGQMTHFTSTAETVEDALAEHFITCKKATMLPKAGSKLVDGTKIFILNKEEKFEFQNVADIPYTTEYTDDPNVEFGREIIGQKGVPGTDQVIYRVKPDGTKTELGRIHKTDPVKQIIRRGIKDTIMTEQGRLHYKKKYTANVTAYTIEDGTGDGITSTLIVPYEGVIAVDPRFIPYDSRIYIPGYGVGLAADCGGMIDDNCIDLFMYDRKQAWAWGRRHIDVYLLD